MEKSIILVLSAEEEQKHEKNEKLFMDCFAEYKKQTGRDLETGKYVTQ